MWIVKQTAALFRLRPFLCLLFNHYKPKNQMSIRKALGGDRLGSGKKMDVTLHGYERSTHDLGYLWRSSMSAGTLVPFMHEIALPGDTFDITLDCDVKTHPTIGPLFGSFKVQLDVFLTPIRLYNSLLHNNMLNVGLDMSKVKFPLIRLTAQPDTETATDIDNCQVNPSCLLKYIGISGIGYNAESAGHERNFNAIGILEYWDIYKNYYANKQEEVGAVIHTEYPTMNKTVDDIYRSTMSGGVIIPQTPGSDAIIFEQGQWLEITYTGATPALDSIFFNTSLGIINGLDIGKDASFISGVISIQFNANKWGSMFINSWRYRNANDPIDVSPNVTFFPLSNIDQMRREILKYDSEISPFFINDTPTPQVGAPYVFLQDASDTDLIPSRLASQEGLACKTYQSDIFNNWLQTEWFDGPGGINEITAIDTSGGSFTIDTLRLSRKVADMLNRIAVSGGSYYDWQEAVYAHQGYRLAETPMYMGGLSKELVFQEVISNAQSTEQPLGTLGGRGILSKKHKGGECIIKVDEASYIMGIVSLTPRVDYSQGNRWDVHLQTMDDLHKPALDEIGFQDLQTETMAWWSTIRNQPEVKWDTFSAGKQPAWINYMTNYNRTYGNFAIADNEMFMTLNRRYERHPDGSIADLTTYIDPAKFNHIFAETALDAQNFWVQIAVDITARRKMSAKVMPNL